MEVPGYRFKLRIPQGFLQECCKGAIGHRL